MAVADIKLNIKKGTTSAPPGGQPGQGGSAWAQGYEQDPNTKEWTVLSAYWYSYSGSNAKNADGTDKPGGEVDMPSAGGDFTVGPKSNEVIDNIIATDAAPTNHYTYTRPGTGQTTWTVHDVGHTDPANTTDYFDVYAKDQADDPVIKCDPIIKNRGGS